MTMAFRPTGLRSWTLAICLTTQFLFLAQRSKCETPFPPVPLETVAKYTAFRTTRPLKIDGKLDEVAWQSAPRSPRFVDLISGQPTKYDTHAAVLWDDDFLYVGYFVQEPNVQARLTERDSFIYTENDVECFIALNDAYYEFEINALGTIYEGLFAWQDRFVDSGLHKIPALDQARAETVFQEFNGVGLTNHPRGLRWAYLQWDFPQLQSAVSIDGTLNDDSDVDQGWSVELAIPWSGFRVPATGDARSIPPSNGDLWRMDFSRFNKNKFDTQLADSPTPDSPTPDSGGWAWSQHGIWDSHIPEVFPMVTFSTQPVELHARQPAPFDNQSLRGFPEAPPPYQVQLAFPQLKMGKALAVGKIPNTESLWLITHDGDYGGPGRIYRFADNQDVQQLELMLERPEILYGVAFDPDFAENHFIYIGCNGDCEELPGKATKVLRATVDPQHGYTIDPNSVTTIIQWPSDGHNGGDLAFGNDGMLYVSAGDGTSDSDGNLTGQDLSSLNGSLLRIDVSGSQDDSPYRVPEDNPFLQTPGARPEIWAYGLRNPWRITYDLASDQLWIGNNGQDLWETAHLARRGENYGWSIMEGSHPFQPNRQQGPTPIVPPTVEHPHSEARSLTGGVVYHGARFPELQGAYIYGDYATGNIWGVRHDGTEVVWKSHLARSSLLISGFGLDSHGEILIVDHQGGLYYLTPQAPAVSTNAFPRRLSETQIYSDISSGQLASTFLPYSVQSPLWSDGAEKTRAMAIPAGSQIALNGTLGWNFPEHSVLVKTFTLPIATGDQVSHRRVETRLMVKIGNEWFGYSYRWNDDQTDAELVDAAGTSTLLTVHDPQTPDVTRQQVWNFPSRIECTVCHTRAANYVLGLSTPQMNRLHDYGTTAVNELDAFQHFGWLKLDAPPETLPKMPNPSDETVALPARALAYLAANCAHCHTNAGGGNSRMEMVFGTPSERLMMIDSDPQHDRFGIADARVISPGHPDQSVIMHRLSLRGKGQMPPLASEVVDQHGTKLIRDWIQSMPK